MINKYQQGGAAPQLGVLAQIQQLPQEQQQQLMQAFAQWAQLKGVDIQQILSNPAALEQALGQFMQEMLQQQAQMARHGAKLQYIKNLKHQCGPDEELQFFKAGGQVGCKCVQKEEKGGKAEPKKNALEQFKAKKACGGIKLKKHQIGGTIEDLRKSLGLEKKNLTKFLLGGAFRSFFSHMSPGFRRAYEEKYRTYPNAPMAPEDMTYKVPQFIPTQNLPGVTMVSSRLPGILVTAPDLSKPQQLGGITVESNNGNSFAYPNGDNLLQEAVNRNKAKRNLVAQKENGGVMKAQAGLHFEGSNKTNRFVSQPVQSIPEITVNGIDRRWRFDTREENHGNGYGVKSLTFFDYYDGGNSYLGDNAPIRGGRTIYISPQGNDTLYWKQPSRWIHYQNGFMPVGGNQPGAKTNFFRNLKRPLIKN